MKRAYIGVIAGICLLVLAVSLTTKTSSVIDVLVKEHELDSPKRNPPGSIEKYVIAGKEYLYIDAACCDQFALLYDSEGKYVCSPSGGISGGGNRLEKCPTLDWDHRVDQGTVWRATKKAK